MRGLTEIECWALIWGENRVQYVEHHNKQASRCLNDIVREQQESEDNFDDDYHGEDKGYE